MEATGRGAHPDRLLEHEKQRLKQIIAEHGISIITAKAYLKFANLLQNSGNHQTALALKELALEILKKFGENDDLAEIHFGISYNLRILCDHEGAIEHLQKALDIWLKVFGEKHKNIGVARANIGAVLAELGRPAEALLQEEGALEIWKGNSKNHLDIVITLNNMSTNLEKLGDHPRALEKAQKALEMSLQFLKTDDPEIARSHENAAKALEALGRAEEAIEHKKKAIEIKERINRKETPLEVIAEEE